MLRNIVSLKNDLSALANQQLQEELAEQEIDNVSDEHMAEARKKILSQFVRHRQNSLIPGIMLIVLSTPQLVQTILDQSHLAPLPLQVRPVLWEFDQSLRLFPLPTTVSRLECQRICAQ
jgi:DNA polymerase epsilon subunit 2